MTISFGPEPGPTVKKAADNVLELIITVFGMELTGRPRDRNCRRNVSPAAIADRLTDTLVIVTRTPPVVPGVLRLGEMVRAARILVQRSGHATPFRRKALKTRVMSTHPQYYSFLCIFVRDNFELLLPSTVLEQNYRQWAQPRIESSEIMDRILDLSAKVC